MLDTDKDGNTVARWYQVEGSPFYCWLDGKMKMDGVCPWCGCKGKHVPICTDTPSKRKAK
ncbi:MAG: hypothetical protein ACFFCW_14370 [Candidatus Hodarchaeota archaeon]